MGIGIIWERKYQSGGARQTDLMDKMAQFLRIIPGRQGGGDFCSGCDLVTPFGPFVVGLLAGIAVVNAIEFMDRIGVTGMTVTQVVGCGMQKGQAEYYRGSQIEVKLLPKIKVEIVLAKVSVETVVETVRRILYTGHIGDGKIFIYDVRSVVKIRTGEVDYETMQGTAD